MSSKGGSRRQAVPDVDNDQLKELLEGHVKEHGAKKAFFFGVYASIGRAEAVQCADLAENYDLLKQVSFWQCRCWDVLMFMCVCLQLFLFRCFLWCLPVKSKTRCFEMSSKIWPRSMVG